MPWITLYGHVFLVAYEQDNEMKIKKEKNNKVMKNMRDIWEGKRYCFHVLEKKSFDFAKEQGKICVWMAQRLIPKGEKPKISSDSRTQPYQITDIF